MKIRLVKNFALIAILFSLMLLACNETVHETCSDQLKCTTLPVDDKALESVKQLRENIAGKWKLASITTVNEFLKTDSTYNSIRNSMCISYNGGIAFFRNNQEFVCEYCYKLDGTEFTHTLNIEGKNVSPYCEQQLQSSNIVIRNDSMLLERRDSFILKQIIYKRADDNYNFKGK